MSKLKFEDLPSALLKEISNKMSFKSSLTLRKLNPICRKLIQGRVELDFNEIGEETMEQICKSVDQHMLYLNKCIQPEERYASPLLTKLLAQHSDKIRHLQVEGPIKGIISLNNLHHLDISRASVQLYNLRTVSLTSFPALREICVNTSMKDFEKTTIFTELTSEHKQLRVRRVSVVGITAEIVRSEQIEVLVSLLRHHAANVRKFTFRPRPQLNLRETSPIATLFSYAREMRRLQQFEVRLFARVEYEECRTLLDVLPSTDHFKILHIYFDYISVPILQNVLRKRTRTIQELRIDNVVQINSECLDYITSLQDYRIAELSMFNVLLKKITR